MRHDNARPGLTIFELVIVLAVLIILAAVTLPSFEGLKGNSEQKASADRVRGLVADARGLAMSEGMPYRLALSSDGKRIRLAPDVAEFAQLPVATEMSAATKAVEIRFERTLIEVEEVSEGEVESAASDDWITIATFLANGTCREISTVLRVNEGTFTPIRIQVRGVTGTATILQADSSPGGMK